MFKTKIMSYEIYKNGYLIAGGSFRYIFRKKYWMNVIVQTYKNMQGDSYHITIKKPR